MRHRSHGPMPSSTALSRCQQNSTATILVVAAFQRPKHKCFAVRWKLRPCRSWQKGPNSWMGDNSIWQTGCTCGCVRSFAGTGRCRYVRQRSRQGLDNSERQKNPQLGASSSQQVLKYVKWVAQQRAAASGSTIISTCAAAACTTHLRL